MIYKMVNHKVEVVSRVATRDFLYMWHEMIGHVADPFRTYTLINSVDSITKKKKNRDGIIQFTDLFWIVRSATSLI